MNTIADNIRRGLIDINNQNLFFSTLIKGLLLNLDNDINIRNIPVPHLIIHTGDDTMFLNKKNYNYSSNNDENIYNIIPRCIVSPGNIDILVDQLSHPYSFGQLQYEDDNGTYVFVGEFRRMPIKLSCDLKYYTDSYTDMLALMQQILTKLTFVKTFYMTYMGQSILCSYKLPESLQEEHLMDIDGTTTDNKSKTLTLSIEIETCLPVWNEKTIMPNTQIIKPKSNINILSTNETI